MKSNKKMIIQDNFETKLAQRILEKKFKVTKFLHLSSKNSSLRMSPPIIN